MDVLTAARAQMEISLGFHMIFAALGIGLPLLMSIAEGMALRTGRREYRDLARKWAKATALTFAVGAVSGTALSFELGLIWPRFMGFAGGIIGPVFGLEGFAFFIEAIFLGLYLYGWDRLSPRAHWWAGLPVAVSGMLSGVLVVAANAWMQRPVGFTLKGGVATRIDPGAVFLNPSWFHMALHSTLSCYIATGFAVAGVYAAGMLKGRRDAYHRAGLGIALAVAGVTIALQPLSGDLSAQSIARAQPLKLAAAEAHYRTRAGAPIVLGGLADSETGTVTGGLEIPGVLSILAFHDPRAVVQGLNEAPRADWPNVALTHLAFDLMVGSAMIMLAIAGWYWFLRWRRAEVGRPWLLRALLAGSPLGFLALEAGWVVTEAGRQPWMVYGVMRTSEGVTPVAEVPVTMWGFAVLYVALGSALVVLLRRLATGDPGDSGRLSADGHA